MNNYYVMPLVTCDGVCERDAVCGACDKEAPASKLMLCDGVCGRALHWAARCARAPGAGGIVEHVQRRPPRTSRQRPSANVAVAKGPGVGPKPKRWFCSSACKDFRSAAVAEDAWLRSEGTEPPPPAGCPLCAAAPVSGDSPAADDAEDMWHLLFTCRHPSMVAIRDEMRLSAISHCAAFSATLLAAVERALLWYPGDAAAAADVRAAAAATRRVAQKCRDAGAGLDMHCTYRLVMALPFSARAIPPEPPPVLASSPPDDRHAASRALGRLYDAVRLG